MQLAKKGTQDFGLFGGNFIFLVSSGNTMRRYAPLLAGLLGFLITQPIVVSVSAANIPVNILVYILLPSAIYAVGPSKALVAIATTLAVFILLTRLAYQENSNTQLLILSHALSFALMVVVTITIVLRVFRAREVTADIIMGAVCVYLVIGLAWSFFYFFLQAMAPGCMMAIPIATRGSLAPAPLEQYRFWEMVYFSMSALSTMGFLSGEPLTPMARQLAVVEAIMGQLYIAVLIARIVALSTANAMKSPKIE